MFAVICDYLQLESIRQRIMWQPAIRFSARPLEPVLADINRHFDAVNIKLALQKHTGHKRCKAIVREFGLVVRAPSIRPLTASLTQNGPLLSTVGVAITLGISDILIAISNLPFFRVEGAK
jgi:hypothetical protein